MNAHELIRIFELSPLNDIKALIKTHQIGRSKSKSKIIKKRRRILRNTRRSEITECQNLEQGVKRLTNSETSRTRLNIKHNTESKNSNFRLSTVRNRVQTAKKRTSRWVS